MSRIAYRLDTIKTGFPSDIMEKIEYSWIYDIDEDYISKNSYIYFAKKYTDRFNKENNTQLTWVELFGEPEDIGWRYCSKCGECFWKEDARYHARHCGDWD